jgi:hypothetical protein
MLVECTFQLTERLLSARQVSRLQSLTHRGEILLSLAPSKRAAVCEWAALAQSLKRLVLLLCSDQIPRLKRLPKLLQIGASLMKVGLQFLIERIGGNGCRRHESLLKCAEMLAVGMLYC